MTALSTKSLLSSLLLSASLLCGTAFAEGPRLGLEYESEKDNNTGMENHAFTVIPGWDFPDERIINSVELLVERNADVGADSDGIRARETKLFLRLRHNGEFTNRFGYYVRGGAGRSYNNARDFNYAYVEPGLEYKLSEHWPLTVAVREIGSIDGTPNQQANKFIIGPGYEPDEQNEFEFRLVKGSGNSNNKSWLVEYVHKF